MRPGSSAALHYGSRDRIKSRSSTPIDSTFLTSTRPYTPYPLYKQKVKSLLKPPDYSRQAPNFMSARETRSDFEKKEASLQVKLLKKTFNMMREDYNTSNRKMNMLVSESIRVKNLEHVGQHDIDYLQKHFKDLGCEETQMLNKIRDEQNNNLTYHHVRERLRQTLMHLELKNQYLQNQIRMKDFLIDSEHRKKIQTLENKFTMVTTYKNNSKAVELDLRDRTQDLNILEDDIKVREKIHELRKTRIKKYEEIAEAAAIDEGDLKSNSIREGLLVHITWAKFMNGRLDVEMKKSGPIEEAFKKIKAATTISDPRDIVQKFLMKEERLSTLMSTLNESRAICQNFRLKNDCLENKINEYILTQKEGKNMDIKHLKAEIETKTCKLAAAKQKLANNEMTATKLKDWVSNKLKNLKPKWRLRDQNMRTLFLELKAIISIQLLNKTQFAADV